MGEEVVFVRRASGLIREIGPFTAMVVGANFTIADGIYNLTQWQSYQTPGANYPLSLILGGLLLTVAAIVIMFLAAASPRACSDYVAISRTIHPIVGYIQAFMGIGIQVWIYGGLAYFMGWYFGSFFIQAGIATNNPAYVALGSWMSADQAVGIALGIIIILLVAVVNLLGIKTFKYTVNILFGIALAAGIVTVGAALYGVAIGPQGVAALWDKTYGTGAFQEIIDVAKQSGYADYITSMTGNPSAYGWPGNWTWGSTLGPALVAASYAFWGMDTQNYIGGEVSKPKRSFLIGTIGAIAICFIYYLAIALPTLQMYGQFTSYYNYVMFGGHGQELLKINTIQTPTIAVMLASILGGIMPWAAIIVTLGVALWVLNGLPVYAIIPTRILFALSFDRMMPQKFAEVNQRFRTPHWSILLTTILAIIFLFITVQNPWFFSLSVVTGVFVRWLFASWAAMVLPFQRPDLYEQGYTWKVGNIPVITIFGGMGTVIMTTLLGIGLGQISSDMNSLAWFVFWFAVGALIFAYYLGKNARRGVKIETLFKEIPPA
jgi:APA family basic amino acid/polyamine antiporter